MALAPFDVYDELIEQLFNLNLTPHEQLKAAPIYEEIRKVATMKAPPQPIMVEKKMWDEIQLEKQKKAAQVEIELMAKAEDTLALTEDYDRAMEILK